MQIRFSIDPNSSSKEFRTGDYWVFAARTADASVEILTKAPPRGIHHHYVQLAAITDLGDKEKQDVSDCRPRPEDPTRQCCCCLFTVGAHEDQHADFTDLTDAVAALPNFTPDKPVPVIVCLLNGDHILSKPVKVTRPHTTIRGCGWGTRLLPEQGAVLKLAGQHQAVESLAIVGKDKSALIHASGRHQRIELCRLENAGPSLTVSAGVDSLTMARNVVLGKGGLVLMGDNIEILENHVNGGPVLVRNGSHTVRIQGNDLHESAADALILNDGGLISEVDVIGNRIREAGRNGIASGSAGLKKGIIDGLRIVGNAIVNCIDPKKAGAQSGLPFGGIVLHDVWDLVARDNCIERNGENATAAVCGIHVANSRGMQIARNIIRNNGHQPTGETFPGPQAGISLRNALPSLGSGGDAPDPDQKVRELGILPAAHVVDNLVESPRGPALYICGQGPMTVEGNRFQATDILGDFSDVSFETLDQYVGTVFLLNAGWPAYLEGILPSLGLFALRDRAPTALTGTPVLTGYAAGGQTQFRGNQARLDLRRPEVECVFANVAIISLDDTVIAGNQTESILAVGTGRAGLAPALAVQFPFDLMLSDLFNIGMTTRQSHNGLLSTPYLTMYSILSLGWVNHCVGNQTTSCIEAWGSPKSITRDNAILFPHPLFCPENRVRAVIHANPTGGVAPLKVWFDGNGSWAESDVVSGYHWDFGDGATSDRPAVEHEYDKPMRAMVQLRVTTRGGLEDTASRIINVTTID